MNCERREPGRRQSRDPKLNRSSRDAIFEKTCPQLMGGTTLDELQNAGEADRKISYKQRSAGACPYTDADKKADYSEQHDGICHV